MMFSIGTHFSPMRLGAVILSVVGLCAFVFWYLSLDVHSTTPVASLVQQPEVVHQLSSEAPPLPTYATTSVWFIGDIMLSREVAVYAQREGYDYPWRLLGNVFDGSWVVANFEACVSTTTTYSNDQTMRFPVRTNMIKPLRDAGITHVSLANNHALDCGRTAYKSSRHYLEQSGLIAFGHSINVDTASIGYFKIGQTRVAVIGIHTLFVTPDPVALAATFKEAALHSDLQVAFVHWGEEYVDRAVPAQRALAGALVALGADVVIGHHPHVVEDIEMIDGVPVIYSLGNFIFDQYFSRAVQEGLGIRLLLTPQPHLELVPFTSLNNRTQTRRMGEVQKSEFLEKLASRSAPGLAEDIRNGVIYFDPQLATSSETAIIAP